MYPRRGRRDREKEREGREGDGIRGTEREGEGLRFAR